MTTETQPKIDEALTAAAGATSPAHKKTPAKASKKETAAASPAKQEKSVTANGGIPASKSPAAPVKKEAEAKSAQSSAPAAADEKNADADAKAGGEPVAKSETQSPAKDPEGSSSASGDAKDEGGAEEAKSDELADAAVQDPAEWATGAEPMTEKQSSFLKLLCEQQGHPFDSSIDKAQASLLINKLKKESAKKRKLDAESGAAAPNKKPAPDGALADPEGWATGAEAATYKQKSFLALLCKQHKEFIDFDKLTKTEASEHIERLKTAAPVNHAE